MKYIFLLLFSLILEANLTYEFNQKKELAILESFDIEPSFLYDPLLNKMRNINESRYKNKRFFKAMDDAYLFIPAIKNILRDYNVPPEFLFLAMAESNFISRAYSRKRAAGLWQFMPRTARLYGLRIDDYVDERRDFIKSTKAAAKYLSYLHRKFGKWYLAAIAYNCGGGYLARAIRRAKSDDLAVLLDYKKKYIPKESRFYIRKILALALMGSDEQFLLHSEYEHLLNRANAYSVSTVRLPRGESLKRVASMLSMSLKDLKKLNRHLKYDFIPPYKNGYEIYIPYIKLTQFKQKYKPKPMQSIYKVYTVKRGDSLIRIGHRYGVSYRVIKDFNGLKTTRLRLRQKLIIPIDTHTKAKKIHSGFYYMVKKGDTLESIAKAHKVSVANIKSQNKLKSDIIRVGEMLKIYE